MKRINVLVLVILLATTGLGFFGAKKDVVATIESESITLTELNERLDLLPAQAKETRESKVRVLNSMIDEMLLVNEAKKNNFDKSEEYKKALAAAEKQLLINMMIRDEINNKLAVTEDDLKSWYEQNKKQFEASEQRQVRHILVEDEKLAKDLYRQLKKGADFITLARNNSIDKSSAVNGGFIPWFEKGQLVPEFEAAAFNLKKRGAISNIVKTQFGYHIIKLEDIKERPEVKFEDMKQQIEQRIKQEKSQTALQNYLIALKEKCKITRDVSKIK